MDLAGPRNAKTTCFAAFYAGKCSAGWLHCQRMEGWACHAMPHHAPPLQNQATQCPFHAMLLA